MSGKFESKNIKIQTSRKKLSWKTIEHVRGLIVQYLISVLIIIIMFAFAFYFTKSVELNKEPIDIIESIYFSGITFLTIGYGDIAPVTHYARILSVIEGVIGLIANGIFIGLLFSIIQKSHEPLIIAKHAIISKDAESGSFMFKTRIGNVENLLVNIKRNVSIVDGVENGNRPLAEYEDSCTNLKYRSTIKVDDEKILNRLQEMKKGNSGLRVRVFFQGQDVETNEFRIIFYEYSSDNIVFAKDYKKLYNHKDNGEAIDPKNTDWGKLGDYDEDKDNLIETEFLKVKYS